MLPTCLQEVFHEQGEEHGGDSKARGGQDAKQSRPVGTALHPEIYGDDVDSSEGDPKRATIDKLGGDQAAGFL